MKPQYYTVYLASVAAKLVQEGFEVKKVELSQKDPKYLVYKFAYTPEVKAALQNILKEKNS